MKTYSSFVDSLKVMAWSVIIALVLVFVLGTAGLWASSADSEGEARSNLGGQNLIALSAGR